MGMRGVDKVLLMNTNDITTPRYYIRSVSDDCDTAARVTKTVSDGKRQ